ncbi:MAG: DNA internalization-related competence protein ComEC/Rec2 [Ignavibacteria bacterium RIFOXYB2_FULL_35_12]|nr:MAG: DNA internalization-related competence protein ComEC/Rec2 [Ignavibacteria bacterium GWA2_36_19]OGU55129.1 MAG: DNA internalization-related competence protein ComEC/Rec2 [Ignavibacteria bacterium GWC2_35_8]OGU59276.1 MAG: DNA internalization-related competence protein ComEC/Rec2 [Ignavibacteria bacterium GWF2_35_20]OGU86531.1 MAG: DNA internalization-related competence protein ComEC/Rec2 [Ignavibacteria bacterium RIFOXYA12_FULL_35_25]OGU86891.1 MAG: DNA internalization-related competence
MKNYPFIRYSLIFISGIVINNFFTIGYELLVLPLIIFLLISILGYFIKHKRMAELVSTISFYLFFFTLGNYLHAIEVESKFFLPDEMKTIEKLVVIGSVQSIDLRKEKEISFNLKSDSIRIDNVYQTREIFLICRVRDNDESLNKLYNKLVPGNIVRIEGTFQKGREDRNPGEFNYDNYLHSQGISGLLYVNDDYDVKIINWNSSAFQTAIFNARKFVDSQIKSLHNAQTAGLLRGLLLADRSNIDYETKTEFVNSGVMHILAVSGLHVGYIVLIFVVVLGRFNIFIRSILTIVGLIAFLLLTGMPPSVFRAVVMAVVIIMAYMANRSTNIFNSLAIAAFIVLSLNPEELFGAGFQLSFLAVLSIAVIYPIMQKYIYSLKLKSKVVNYILLFMGVSLSAQLGTLPLTLIYFGKLSSVSLLTNLIVIPLAGVIVGIAIFTLTLSLFISSIAIFYSSANEIIIYTLYKIISFAGSNQYSFIPIKNFTLYDSAIFYAAIVLIILGLTQFKSVAGKIIFMILVITNAVLLSSFDNRNLLEDNNLNVMMIDVSQGDATLIKFPNGQSALIDGGYASFYFDNGKRIIRPLLNHLDIYKIDYAFVSSITQESYGGFIPLIRSGIIRNIIKPMPDSSSMVDIKFEELIHENNISIKYFRKDVLEIHEVKIYLLNDENSTSFIRTKNNQTGVFKLVYGNTSFLFPGNIENEAEYFYCDEYKNFLKSDVLKIANNGSINSTSLEFLQTVQPKMSLISVANQNKFVKTSPFILERLKKMNSQIYRTDQEGAVLLQSDGVKIRKARWK